FQPGSTMKPFTFAEWLNEGKSMNTVLNGAVRRYPLNFRWKNTCPTPVDGAYNTAEKGLGAAEDLQNAEEGYYKNMSVVDGLANSINTMTFATAAQVDLCGIQKIVDAVGIHAGQTNEPVPMTRLSNLIGATQTSPLTMASAFATFANDGKYCEPIAIESVTDATGAQLPAQATSCRDAIKPEVARGVSSALQEVLNRGSGSLIKPRISTRTSFPVAAKTGTNDPNNSTWVVGYTSGLATASWFGDALEGQTRYGRNLTLNDKFYKAIDGYMIAGPQFSNYMLEVAPAYGTNSFAAPPSNLVTGPAPAPAPRPSTQSMPAPAPSSPAPEEKPSEEPKKDTDK
ncbi:MAG: penicillin-binding transpeptidase domain-containing protein, partial [Arthrobacter sp.]